VNRGIAPIVEGIGEVASVPVLLRRLLHSLGVFDVHVLKPYRVPRTLVVKEGQIEGAVDQVIRSRTGVSAILLILDADDDCPARLGPELVGRCNRITNLPVAVTFATRELEAWFLGAKESLRGKCGIRADASAPDEPEAIRGAKERLSKNMAGNRRYVEVRDQVILAAQMDMDTSRQRCPSFARLVREVQRLLSEIRP
jgi:hypothetical protein